MSISSGVAKTMIVTLSFHGKDVYKRQDLLWNLDKGDRRDVEKINFRVELGP